MKKPDKFRDLGYVLGQFGDSKIVHAQFWAHMNEHGWGQDDIDWWLEEDRRRDHERQREEQSRAERAATERYARSSRRSEQGDYRQERPGDQQDAQGQEQARQESGGAVQGQEARKGSLTLDKKWSDYAIDIGWQRFDFAEARGWRNYGINPEGDPMYDIMGCFAELILCARYKEKWKPSVGDLDTIDCGKIVEVRGRPPDKGLGIRPKDKKWLPHVLVWVYPDWSMDIKGWLYGHEGMHEVEEGEEPDERWNTNSKCWYNPPPYRPIEELDEIVADGEAVERILQRHLAWKKDKKDRR